MHQKLLGGGLCPDPPGELTVPTGPCCIYERADGKDKGGDADLPSLPHLAGDSRILEPSPAHLPRQSVKTVATRCYILRLKFTKFHFGWGSVPDPAGETHSASPDPWLDLTWVLLLSTVF